jgi:glycosyltransferase involved in cell wall biosynthesis
MNVTAVMVTGKTPAHERWARVAVRCFLEQSWPPDRRELLIVNDGQYELGPSYEYCRADGRPLVREVMLPSRRHTLGELRNRAMELAWGDCLVQWDDDDWHGPERIRRQVQPLLDAPEIVCSFLKRQVRYSFPHNNAKVYHSARIHGTVLHRKTDIRYPDRRKSEDTDFLHSLLRRYGRRAFADLDIPPAECGQLYIRFHHSDEENTWNRAHIMGLFAPRAGEWRIPAPARPLLQTVLHEYYGRDVAPNR